MSNDPQTMTPVDFEAVVDRVAAQQGWTDDTIRRLTITFLGYVADEATRAKFVAYLADVQAAENATDEDEIDDEDDDDEDGN